MRQAGAKRVKQWSKKLILAKIRELHVKGESLRPKDNGYLYQAAIKYFGSYQAALEKAGLSYEAVGIKPNDRNKWNRARIIKEILKLHQKGTSLNSYSLSTVNSALYAAAKRYFGNFEKAVENAGLDYKKIKKVWNVKEWLSSLNEEHLDELRQRIDKLYLKGGDMDEPN